MIVVYTGGNRNDRFSLGVRGKGGEREIKKSKRERERKKRDKGGGFDYCAKSPKKGNFKPLFSAEGQRSMTRVSAGAKNCFVFAIFTRPIIHLVFPPDFENNKLIRLTMRPSRRTKELRPMAVYLT